ncbi:hypothetical protein P389DRAFT_208906 [Cystobasidium minutum MCA 4210]|uniref:uncharacterized protein n=1 Tax=Cystobasidium minutum MCA 4210 TaxID=1397322 RepID=UPI0034CF49E4|eukprot:jgi/Rhomi1/208906/estExt_Genemark1.C_2_t20166
MGKKKEPSPPVENEELDEGEFEVRKIVGHKMDEEETDRVRYLYRVRWVGYTSADDTWEPRESLEGGAEVILQQYIDRRKDKGYVFFRDGQRKSKVAKYLQANGVGEEVLSFDAGDDEAALSSDEEGFEPEDDEEARKKSKKEKKKSSSSSSNDRDGEKDKKRKKRESEAAAADEDDQMDQDEGASYKKSRRTSGSPMTIPPSVLRGRDERDKAKKEKSEKENSASLAAESSRFKKPSSKRSEEDTLSSLNKKKETRRPSTALAHESDEEDARAAKEIGEALKRSPLKEKKADQQSTRRKSEEVAPRSSSSNKVPPITPEEPIKVATLPATEQHNNTHEEEEEEEEEDLPLGSDINRKLPSWEGLLIVESLEQSHSSSTTTPPPNGTTIGDAKEYKWLIRWNENIQAGTKIMPEEWVGNTLARNKFPQGLLSFYEDHLKFKSTPEDEDDLPNAGGVNGDDGTAMDQN